MRPRISTVPKFIARGSRSGSSAMAECLAACLALLAAVAPLLITLPASADPVVFIQPFCLEIETGEIRNVHLSVTDTGDPISCFYAVIAFDPAVIDIRDVREGNLYANSPHPTFPIFEQTYPDSFEVGNCVLGSGTFVLGPGALAEIEIEGLMDGMEPLRIGFVDVRDIDRESYPNLVVEDCATTAIVPSPGPAYGARLIAWPNPAILGHAVGISVAGTAPGGPLRVYDIGGRICREMGGPNAGGGPVLRWDGRDAEGHLLSPGLYLLRGGKHGELTTKLLLVR